MDFCPISSTSARVSTGKSGMASYRRQASMRKFTSMVEEAEVIRNCTASERRMGCPSVTDFSLPGVRLRKRILPRSTEKGRAMRVLIPARTPIFTPHQRPSAVCHCQLNTAERSSRQVTSTASQVSSVTGIPPMVPFSMGMVMIPLPFGKVYTLPETLTSWAAKDAREISR